MSVWNNPTIVSFPINFLLVSYGDMKPDWCGSCCLSSAASTSMGALSVVPKSLSAKASHVCINKCVRLCVWGRMLLWALHYRTIKSQELEGMQNHRLIWINLGHIALYRHTNIHPLNTIEPFNLYIGVDCRFGLGAGVGRQFVHL